MSVDFTRFTVNSDIRDATGISFLDLNGDKLQDITAVSSGWDTDQVLWHRSNEGGSISTTASHVGNVTGSRNALYGADMDRDGDIDIVAAETSGDDIDLFYNTNGIGTSWSVLKVADGFDGATKVYLADYATDGYPDIVAVCNNEDDVAIWRQTSKGVFAKTSIDLGLMNAAAVYGGDINRDGKPDVIAGGSQGVFWYQNLDNGSTWAKYGITSSLQPEDIKLADLNGDGWLDAAIATATGIYTWMNGGTISTVASLNAQQVAIADIDHDGDNDLVFGSYSAGATLYWYSNNGKGSFESKQIDNIGLNNIKAVATGDADNDGFADIAISTFGEDDIYWYRNNLRKISVEPGTQTIKTNPSEPITLGGFKISMDEASPRTIALSSMYSLTGQAGREIDYTIEEYNFYSGYTYAEIVVIPTNDLVFDPNETVIITLKGNGIEDGWVVDPSKSSATLNIGDPTPVISIVSASDPAEPDSDSGVGKAGIISIELNSPSPVSIRVPYRLSGSTGDVVIDDDQDPSNGYLNGEIPIEAGHTSKEVFVFANNDTTFEQGEYVELTLLPEAPFYNNIAVTDTYRVDKAKNSAKLIIEDNEPTVNFGAIKDIQEGDPFGEFIGYVDLELDYEASIASGLRVYYSISGGTATQFTDYFNSQGRLSAESTTEDVVFIPYGAKSARLYLSALPDAIAEEQETITISISKDKNPNTYEYAVGETYAIGNRSTVTLTISDSGGYTPSIAVLDREGVPVTTSMPLEASSAGQVEFGIRLTSQPKADVVVAIAGITFTFTPLNWYNSQTVTWTGTKSLTATSTSSDISYNNLSSIISIIADDGNPHLTATEGEEQLPTIKPTASIFVEKEVAEGSELLGAFTILLSNPAPVGGLQVNYQVSGTAAANTDYQMLSGRATIVAGESRATINIAVIDDNRMEGDESVMIELLSAEDYLLNADSTAELTLADNDIAGVTFARAQETASISADSEQLDIRVLSFNDRSGSFTVALMQAPTTTMTVTVMDNLNENNRKSLVFTTENWTSPQTVTLSGLTEIANGEHQYELKAVSGYEDGNDPSETVIVPIVTNQLITSISSILTTENQTEQLLIRLNSQPSSDVSLSFSDIDASETAFGSGQVAFNTSNWDIYQSLTIRGLVDNRADGDVTYNVKATASSGDPGYNGTYSLLPVTTIDIDSDVINNEPAKDDNVELDPLVSITLVSAETISERADSTGVFRISVNQADNGESVRVRYSVLTKPGEHEATEGVDYEAFSFFEEKQGDDSPFLVDAGSYSAPAMIDLDGDDDLDLVLGNYDGIIHYYENIGNRSQASFIKSLSSPFSGIDLGGNTSPGHSTPTFVDLDSDGDQDLVLGSSDGKIRYYRNTNLAFTETSGSDNPFQSIDVPSHSAPTLADYDADGDHDLFVGCGDGSIKLFKNKGTESYADFDDQDEQNPFMGISLEENASIIFADLDGDNDIDAVLTGDKNASSSSDASMQYWVNNGSPSQANFVQDNSLLARSNFNIRDNVRPAFADIDGDSDADLLFGNLQGVIDYYENLSSGELAIIPGQYQDVELKPLADAIAEGDESVTVILNTNQGYFIDTSNNTIKFTIADDDVAGVRITDSGGADATTKVYSTREAEARGQLFEVKLTSQPLDSVTVYLGSTMQTEASLSAEYQDDQRIISLYFTPTNWDIAQSFTVNPKDDLIDDGETAYGINTTVRSGDDKYKNIKANPISFINEDDDVAGIRVESLDDSIGEGSQNTIQLSLETQPEAPVAIRLTPSNGEIRFGGQAFTQPLTLTFTEQNWSLPQAVSVLAVNDSKVEYNHNTSISFQIETEDSQYAALTPPAAIEVSIQDNDFPLASLDVAQNAAEEAIPGYFTITLSEAASAAIGATGIVVSYQILTSSSAINGVDYQPIISTGSTRIAPGRNSTPIVISPIDNSKVEADKQVTIQLLAGEGYDLGDSSLNTLVITNNDEAGVQIIQSGIVPVVKEGQSYSFYVSLLSEPTKPTTIEFVDTGSQLDEINNITFESANWYIPQKVTITGTDENVAEAGDNHTTKLRFGFTGADEYVNMDEPVELEINIIDRTFDSVNASLGLEYSLNSFERAFTESSLALIGSASKLPIFFDEITKAITNKVYATNNLTAWKLEQILKEQLEATLGENLSGLNIDCIVTDKDTSFAVKFKTIYLDQIVELAPDLALPMLELDVHGEVQLDIEHNFELDFGFSNEEGYYLDSSRTVLNTKVSLDRVSLDEKDCINGLSVDLQDNGSVVKLDYAITMQPLGVQGANDDLSTNEKVTTSQLQPLLSKSSEELFTYFEYEFTEDSEIKLAVNASPDDAIIDYFPGLYFMYETEGIPLLNYADPTKVAAAVFYVKILKAALDIQSMARGYVKKYIDMIDDILQPFYPIIDTLNANTKFLSALELDFLFDSNNDGKVSILEMLMAFLNVKDDSGDNDVLKNLGIKGFDDGDTLDFYEFIDAINELIEVVRIVDEYLESPTNVLIDIGELRAKATHGELEFEKVEPINGDILTRIKESSLATDDLVKLIDSILAIDGLEIPLLTDFLTVAKLLTGENNVDFLTYDIPDLDVDLSVDLSDIGLEAILPGYGLDSILSLSIGLKTDLYLAYDSYGLDLWKEEVCQDRTATKEEKDNDKESNNAMLLLEGLYIRDVDAKGKDGSELAASFGVDIGLEANAVIARARMTGGVQSDNDVKIDFFDTDEEIYGSELSPTRDGIIRYGEFAPLFSGDLSVLEVNGAIEAFLNTKLEVGVDLGITEVMETILDIDIYTYTLWDAEYALSKIGLKGFASQSPLQNGTVFFDANMNGKLDAGEPVSVSHEDGSFNVTVDRNAYDRNRNGRIDSTEGRLVIIDGVDAATGLPMATPLFASVDSSMITPLTSMIQKLEQDGIAPALAEARIKQIFALLPDIDLTSYNPATAIAAGDESGRQVYVAHVMSQASFALFSQFISGVTNQSVEQVADQVIGVVSGCLYEDEEAGFGNYDFIRRLVGTLVSEFSDGYSDAQEEEIATVVSRVLTVSDQIVSTTADNSSLGELVSRLSPLKAEIQHDLGHLLNQFGEGRVSAAFVDQSLNHWQARVQQSANTSHLEALVLALQAMGLSHGEARVKVLEAFALPEDYEPANYPASLPTNETERLKVETLEHQLSVLFTLTAQVLQAGGLTDLQESSWLISRATAAATLAGGRLDLSDAEVIRRIVDDAVSHSNLTVDNAIKESKAERVPAVNQSLDVVNTETSGTDDAITKQRQIVEKSLEETAIYQYPVPLATDLYEGKSLYAPQAVDTQFQIAALNVSGSYSLVIKTQDGRSITLLENKPGGAGSSLAKTFDAITFDLLMGSESKFFGSLVSAPKGLTALTTSGMELVLNIDGKTFSSLTPGQFELASKGSQALALAFRDNGRTVAEFSINTPVFLTPGLTTTEKKEVDLVIGRSASFENSIGLYRVDDLTGTIISGDRKVHPGDADYARLAVESAKTSGLVFATPANMTTQQHRLHLPGASNFGFFLIVNNSVDAYLGQGTKPVHALFSYHEANTNQRHAFASLGNNFYSFEDSVDNDMNDIVMRFSFAGG